MVKNNYRKIGEKYEKAAGDFLQNHGYKIIEYNYRCRSGEIDIIAVNEGYLVFCEVKYRRTEVAGHPLEAIPISKQRTISKCARYYIHTKKLYGMPCRFDVLGILGTEFQLVKNAFEFME